MDLFDNAGVRLSNRVASEKQIARSGAFTDNMKLPVHRWFRYSAGFSAEWVQAEVRSRVTNGRLSVLDPFCGSGTTLVAAAAEGADAVGFEAHPFIVRIARAKTQREFEPTDYLQRCESILESATRNERIVPQSDSDLLRRCYSDISLVRLEALRESYIRQRVADQIDDLIWLTITSILRECSGVGTAQWQYLLPTRSKSKVVDPFYAFKTKAMQIAADLSTAQARGSMSIAQTDARSPDFSGKFDLVITSPPYPNNYDYADATRLEMVFWGEISTWGDLQGAVRQFLVRACSQHSAAERLVLDDVLGNSALGPIRDELSIVCRELDAMRLIKAGKKNYHTMVAAYFLDLAQVWNGLRNLVRDGGEVAFVIGDSAPYGVYVPCDRWMIELAKAAGFHNPSFEKFRDRNVKWKNRKHQVPLKEGVLWVKG